MATSQHLSSPDTVTETITFFHFHLQSFFLIAGKNEKKKKVWALSWGINNNYKRMTKSPLNFFFSSFEALIIFMMCVSRIK